MHGFWAGRGSSIFGVWVAPGAPETFRKWGRTSRPHILELGGCPWISDLGLKSTISGADMRAPILAFRSPGAGVKAWVLQGTPYDLVAAVHLGF